MALNMIVCAKQIPDPEAPASSLKIDEAAKKVVPAPGVSAVISQFDELAVEAALRIKDAQGEGKITIITMGPANAREVLKHGLAMGADEGVLLSDDAFGNSDSYTAAVALTAAIKKLSEFDLILCGRQAADWDMGSTGSAIAEMLDIPSVTIAKGVTYQGGKVLVDRVLSDGYETVEASLPCLVTISNEIGEPRYPKLQQIMLAARKQVTTWSAADLGLDSSQIGGQGARLSLERLFAPVSDIECEVVEADTPDEAAQKLAQRLREAKVI